MTTTLSNEYRDEVSALKKQLAAAEALARAANRIVMHWLADGLPDLHDPIWANLYQALRAYHEAHPEDGK